MKKALLFLQVSILSSVLFADKENYDGQDVSGKNFSNCQLVESSWDGATAIGTNFSSSNLTKAYFNNANLTSANFANAFLTSAYFWDATITGADFSNTNLKENQIKYTKSYLDKDLRGINFSNNSLVDWDFSNQNLSSSNFTAAKLNSANFANANLSSANFSNANFTYADLSNANFSNAIIKGANFFSTVSYGFTETQLKSTKSYNEKDLGGISLDSNDLSGWHFEGQNLNSASFGSTIADGTNFINATLTSANFKKASLKNANFNNATLKGANMQKADLTNAILGNADLSNVDLRGATLTDADSATAIYKNTIMADGTIKNFSMTSSEDNLLISLYDDIDGEPVSAKISEDDARISGGANLTLAKNSMLDITNGKILTVASDGTIQINQTLTESTKFKVDGNAEMIFEVGATLAVNISGDMEDDVYKIAIISFEDDSRIVGLSDLVCGETLFLTVNGETYKGLWDYELKNDGLYVLINIPEPATYAIIFGVLALGFAVRRNL